MINIPEDTHILKLRDNRNLAYTIHGDPNGTPVFFLHGNPGSRYMRHPDEGIVEDLGICLITPDRPGFGFSDFKPNRKLIEYPDDLIQLADYLEIEKFQVFGVSAGGPYVAACAYSHPERVTQAAIVSGAAPFNRRGALRGVNHAYQAVFRTSAQMPYVALRPLIEAQIQIALHQPHKMWMQRLHIASKGDRYVLDELEINEEIDEYYREAARFGAKGIAWESKIVVSPWGFYPNQIRVPIHLWYWEDDSIVPQQMGQFLHSQIPNSIPHFHSGGGHYAIFEFWEQILSEFVV